VPNRPLQTTRPDGGWVKTDYWDNWLAVASSQQVDEGKLRFKFEQMDGAGRAYKKASDHPDGADGVSGKFAGQISVFDKVGQVQDSSNVLAIDGSWIPSGEDVGKSFLYTHLTRDELARLKLVTLPDNNTRELDYEGCGCAGNNETRVTDELGHATITKNDARGRLIEAIEENPTNQYVPYSKAEYVYDELDRLIAINHSGLPLSYGGARPTQTRTFAYDGYGRMTTETTPEGGTVTYTYTANDQVWQVTNQRPVTTIYAYNTRGLLTNVSYSDSTPAVTYSYDAYGARTTMTDGEGQTNYTYNAYRQLQSETRMFSGLPSKSYTLNYNYNQGDQVTRMHYYGESVQKDENEEPQTIVLYDKNVNYAYNTVGALASIGTNLIGGNTATNVLNNLTFRASGALNQLNYGNGRRLTMGYNDNRNQPTSMVVDRTNNPADKVVDYAYQYYDANGKNNNRIRQITDNIETAYSTTYTYDDYNRLTNATANAFSRSYSFDEWGNIKNFAGLTLNGCGSFRTTEKLQKIGSFRKVAFS